MLADISRHGRTGAMEVQAGGQLVGQEGEVEGLAVGEDVGEEVVSGLRPGRVVRAAGRLRCEAGLVGEPLMAQLIEAGATDEEAFGGGGGIQLTGVEGFEDLLDVERWRALRELFLFMGDGAWRRRRRGSRRGSFSL